MKIYLIRHGDPDYENDTLTPHGHEEAKILAEYLEREGIDEIYSSPKGRARATAGYTAERLGMTFSVADWTAELDLRRDVPPLSMAWDTNGSEIRRGDYIEHPWEYDRIPEFPADRVRETAERLRRDSDLFLRGLGYERRDGSYLVVNGNRKKVALFAHGGFGLTWLAVLLEIPVPLMWAGFFLHTTSVTQILFDERGGGTAVPRCLMIGALPHLYRAGLEPTRAGIRANHE